MLVLTRKSQESVILGDTIEVRVLNVKGEQVSLGFTAPREIGIYRKEVYEAIQRENQEAVRAHPDQMKQALAGLGKQLTKTPA